MITPKIDAYHFGQIVIDGQRYLNDVIILPDRVIGKWWRDEGHRLALEDLGEALQMLPEILVIGQGNIGRMEVPDDTLRQLEEAGIDVIMETTGRACDIYNQLCEKRRVVAALHLTC